MVSKLIRSPSTILNRGWVRLPAFIYAWYCKQHGPFAQVTCVALKYRTEDELPQLYDKQLLSVFYEGSMEEVRTRVLGDKSARVANAQNANGETVLMKVCRRALSGNDKGGGLSVVSLLLKSGANPMVCCDSGKNVLHDVSCLCNSLIDPGCPGQPQVFWTAKPPPCAVLEAMEKMVGILREATGKNGLLELMLSEDKHGYTPLDYVVPSLQPNWRKIVDTVVAWATEEDLALHNVMPVDEMPQDTGGEPGDARQGKRVEVASCRLEVETSDRNFVSTVVEDMHPDDKLLVVKLSSFKSSFLISDIADPDAAIIALSPSFVRDTGYSADDVLGRNCRFLQGPGTSTAQVDQIRKALTTNSSVNVSLLNYKKNGDAFMNNFLLTPLRRADSTVVYYIGVQNCPVEVATDRRLRLAATGSTWLDDTTLSNRHLDPHQDQAEGTRFVRSVRWDTAYYDLPAVISANFPQADGPQKAGSHSEEADKKDILKRAASGESQQRMVSFPHFSPASDATPFGDVDQAESVEPSIKRKRVSACTVC